MRIAKGCGVGDHDARITMLPERPLVRPTNTRNERWQRRPFGWNFGVFSEETDDSTEQITRRNVADESDEVANTGIKHAQPGRRISLRMWRVRKISDRFQANHRRDAIAAGLTSPGVNEASHLTCPKKRRLLVHKRDEA